MKQTPSFESGGQLVFALLLLLIQLENALPYLGKSVREGLKTWVLKHCLLCYKLRGILLPAGELSQCRDLQQLLQSIFWSVLPCHNSPPQQDAICHSR